MAVLGLALIGFLIMHLLGNFAIFKGAEAFNHYSHFLTSNPLLPIAEIALLLFFVGHAVTGIQVTLQNRKARPIPYAMKKGAGHASRKTFSSTTMIISGILVLAFVPLHILMFKYGPFYPSLNDPEIRDIYRLVIEEFQEPGEVIFYVVAMAAVGFHLFHGVGSAFESMGVSYKPGLSRFGKVLAVAIASLFALIPVVIYVTKGQL